MNIGNFELNFKNLFSEKNNEVTNFMNELKTFLENSITNKISNEQTLNNLKDGSIYVVTDIIDEKLSLLDIDDGNEFNVSISISNMDNSSNICYMQKEEFHKLDLGSNLIFKDGSLSIYDKDITITNSSVSSKLEDLYFNLSQEEGQVYVVDKVSDEKVYLTGQDGQGYFYVYKDLYPNFKVGDLVKKQNKKYLLLEK